MTVWGGPCGCRRAGLAAGMVERLGARYQCLLYVSARREINCSSTAHFTKAFSVITAENTAIGKGRELVCVAVT